MHAPTHPGAPGRGLRRLLPGIALTGITAMLGAILLIALASPAGASSHILYVGDRVGDNTGCADPGYIDISDALDAAGDGDIVHICADTYDDEDGLTVDNDITIRGDGASSTIIDAGGDGPIFTFDEVDAVLEDVTLRHGVDTDGGAIYNNGGSLTVNHSTFRNNEAEDAGSGDGGAIYNDGGDVTISHSTFEGNTTDDEGGAIYNSGGSLTINHSTFRDNEADPGSWRDGGAIYNDGGTVTVSDSVFEGNEAGDDGGAIYNNGGTVTVSDSVFEGNEAGDDGGAIYNSGGSLTINDSVFEQNAANLWRGGAIYTTGGTLTIDETTFRENRAYGAGAVQLYSGVLTITNSTFHTNEATSGTGGAIRLNSSSSVTNISGSVFLDNTADGNGGAIRHTQGLFHLENSTFSGNVSGSDGGAIHLNSGQTFIDGSLFSNNTADREGGALYLDDDFARITNSEFHGNTADYGGAIYNAEDTFELIGSLLYDNTATYYGGGVYHEEDQGTIRNSVIINNHAAEDGGGIFHEDDVLEITGSVITGNTADEDGDQIWAGGTLLTVRYSMLDDGPNAVFNDGNMDARSNWWGSATGPAAGTFSGAGTPVPAAPWLATLDLESDGPILSATLRDSDGDAVTGTNAGLEVRFSVGASDSDVLLSGAGTAGHFSLVGGTAQAELLIAGEQTGLLSGSVTVEAGDPSAPPPFPGLPEPTPTPDPEPEATGTLTPEPVVGGITLSVWSGGEIADLPAAISYWVVVDGVFVGYIPGADDFVNADFLAHFEDGTIPAGTVLIVVR